MFFWVFVLLAVLKRSAWMDLHSSGNDDDRLISAFLDTGAHEKLK